jgi:hypothetical protein
LDPAGAEADAAGAEAAVAFFAFLVFFLVFLTFFAVGAETAGDEADAAAEVDADADAEGAPGLAAKVELANTPTISMTIRFFIFLRPWMIHWKIGDSCESLQVTEHAGVG